MTLDAGFFRRLAKIERDLARIEVREHGGAAAGGGKPYATIVIAASNSTAADAASADYVCDGTADDVELNSAIAACTVGGRIILLEGTYEISAEVDIDVADITVEGQGEGTVLQVPATASTTYNVLDSTVAGVRIANLQIDGNKAAAGGSQTGIRTTGDRNIIENIYILNMENRGINVNGADDLIVRKCIIKDPDSASIYINDSERVKIIDNEIDITAGNVTYGIALFDCGSFTVRGNTIRRFDGNADKAIIIQWFYDNPGVGNLTGNIIDGWLEGIQVSSSSYPSSTSAMINIIGNNILNVGDIGIWFDVVDYSAITGNVCESCFTGISVSNSQYCNITANTVTNCTRQGIILDGTPASPCTHNLVSGNVLVDNCATATDNTIPQLELDTDVDDCFVTGNRIFSNDVVAGSGNRPNYALEIIASTCDDNVVAYNDFLDGGVVGFVAGGAGDAGTGTIGDLTTYGAGNSHNRI